MSVVQHSSWHVLLDSTTSFIGVDGVPTFFGTCGHSTLVCENRARQAVWLQHPDLHDAKQITANLVRFSTYEILKHMIHMKWPSGLATCNLKYWLAIRFQQSHSQGPASRAILSITTNGFRELAVPASWILEDIATHSHSWISMSWISLYLSLKRSKSHIALGSLGKVTKAERTMPLSLGAPRDSTGDDLNKAEDWRLETRNAQ